MQMKEIRFFGASLLMMLIMGCSNNERLIDKYEAAMEIGDYEEARELLNKIDEDKLTADQTARILKISSGGSALADMLIQCGQELGDAIDRNITEERKDKTLEIIGESVDYSGLFYDEMLEDIDQMLDESMQSITK